MSGFPRWIRKSPDTDGHSRSIAAIAAEVCTPDPASDGGRAARPEDALCAAPGGTTAGVRGSAERRASMPLLGRLVAFYDARRAG